MRRVGDDFLHHAADLFQLFHEIHLRLKPACCIDEDHVGAARFGRRHRVKSDRRRIRAFRVLHDIRAGALRPDGQLLGSGRAERIRRREEHFFPFFAHLAGQLPDGRRLAHAVHADDQVHFRMVELSFFLPVRAQHIRHDLLHVRHHFVRIGYLPFSDAAADLPHQVIRRAHPQVARQKHRLQIIQKIFVDLRVADDDGLYIFDQAFFGAFQPFFDLVKKSHVIPP